METCPSRPQSEDDLGFALPEAPRPSRRRLVAVAAGAALVVAIAFLVAFLPARRDRARLVAAAREAAHAPLRVRVVRPQRAGDGSALRLPATVRADREADLYARASGYLAAWRVDMGDRVAKGQLLAEIDTPDLDQELLRARASLRRSRAAVTQAEARRAFARVTLERYERLTPAYTSQQELEQRRVDAEVSEADLAAARAAVRASEADVRRLTDLKGFSRVTAPFAGVVTERYVEVGSLVSAGTANGKPLFRLSAADPVRVTVDVPQHEAGAIRVGDGAALSVREFPGRQFTGKVARAAGALDSGSRTMSVQVDVPNPGGELYAGMYGEIELRLAEPHALLALPGNTIVAGARGLELALVVDGKVHLVPIVVERDTGLQIEVADGVAADADVILNPPPSLVEGAPVEMVRDTPVQQF